ncbi:MAP3K12-binding inhibitory protein 1 [Hyla sarda]|uniref:MAP3K12-binding inhibitory protein 1 n=1 Tax=Hyla sarda TaxID=327740 RepID=UPI0024C28919|nr:MAP3K12-binding inhibitory protein 1 [Hyla sarda]XP_056402252.1 MAP3K12-binding inhibitory protein 1 [Hyla sarda]
MAATVKQTAKVANGESSHMKAYKEAVHGILRTLQSCVKNLQQPEEAVNMSVNWEKIKCSSDVKPAFLRSVLQQHISGLQPLVDQLKDLESIKEEKDSDIQQTRETPCTGESKENIKVGRIGTKHPNKNSEHLPDPSVVQIQAGKSEIDRRILAFIERKQAEINENNVREFCNVIDCNQENSCARTDAVFTPYPGFKSHIKVSRVVNAYGPQTRTDGSSSNSRAHSLPHDCGNQAVEERLQNIEYHLRLNPGGPVPKDIYQRIKKLEDRILELEGISPEYFQSMEMSNKRRKIQTSQSYSLMELDQKINALRQSLYKKANMESLEKM